MTVCWLNEYVKHFIVNQRENAKEENSKGLHIYLYFSQHFVVANSDYLLS